MVKKIILVIAIIIIIIVVWYYLIRPKTEIKTTSLDYINPGLTVGPKIVNSRG